MYFFAEKIALDFSKYPLQRCNWVVHLSFARDTLLIHARISYCYTWHEELVSSYSFCLWKHGCALPSILYKMLIRSTILIYKMRGNSHGFNLTVHYQFQWVTRILAGLWTCWTSSLGKRHCLALHDLDGSSKMTRFFQISYVCPMTKRHWFGWHSICSDNSAHYLFNGSSQYHVPSRKP